MTTFERVTLYVYRHSTATQFAQLVWVLNEVFRAHKEAK